MQYSDIDYARQLITNARDFYLGDLPSHVGNYDLTLFAVHAEAWAADRTLAIDDIAADPRLGDGEKEVMMAASVRAAVSVPVVKDGRTVVVMAALSGAPRRWSPAEVALVEEVADRTWAVVDKARAEAALRHSEARLRQFGEASQDVLWIRDAATLQWTYLTPAFETIYGLSREEALAGRQLSKLGGADPARGSRARDGHNRPGARGQARHL